MVPRRVVVIAVCVAFAVVSASAQTELDHIVSRVLNRIVTQGDISQARTLKLVEDTSSDDAVRQALENRILILSEMSRLAMPVAAPDSDLQQRRTAWEASLGGQPAAWLAKAGMSENSLMAWLRDDVRIGIYVARQFSGVPDADRSKAQAEWVTRLRQRAGLK